MAANPTAIIILVNQRGKVVKKLSPHSCLRSIIENTIKEMSMPLKATISFLLPTFTLVLDNMMLSETIDTSITKSMNGFI